MYSSTGEARAARGEGPAEAKPLRASFGVEGMTCANCVGRVERALRKQEGVVSARVNLATSRADVEYRPSVTGVARLLRAVGDAGYTPVAAGEGAPAGMPSGTASLKSETILALAFGLPLAA